MKKTSKPTPKIPARQAAATKQSATKLKAKPSTSTFMKKASKSGSAPKPAPTRTATNSYSPKSNATAKSPAKPNATTKSSPKPKPRETQGQAELPEIFATINRLTQGQDRVIENLDMTLNSVNRLAQMVEDLTTSVKQLAEVRIEPSQAGEQHDKTLETPEPLGNETVEEEATDLAASQHREIVDASDLTAPTEETNTTDSKALEEYPGIPEPSEDE